MPGISIEQEDPRRAGVETLVKALNGHDEALYPPDANYHLSVEDLCSPDIALFVARQDGAAIGIGALWLRKEWGLGEVKRMYVDPAKRGKGVAFQILGQIELLARAHKTPVLMLETGPLSHDALKLYQGAGFKLRGPFADYPDGPFSVFMEKRLSQAPLHSTGQRPISWHNRRTGGMTITAAEIQQLIELAMPDATVLVQDPLNDGTHFSASVTSPSFKGKSRVSQQQMVYAALGSRMGGEIHALALTTSVPA